MALLLVLVRKPQSHLSHVKFSVQFPCARCASGERPLHVGSEGLLLTRGDAAVCVWDLE